MAQATKNKKNISSALDYIKQSNLCKPEDNKWILGLINKVLSDTLENVDVEEVVSNFMPISEKSKVKRERSISEKSKLNTTKNVSELTIKKIPSIESIENVGLLKVDKPIPLSDGLNVFYGKNGAGKSSLFYSICKLLGKSKHISRFMPNIDSSSDSESKCVLKIVDIDGVEKLVHWSNREENPEVPIMIFDSTICNFLVNDNQVNEFKIAHLKAEYFSFLQDLYQTLETKFNNSKDKLQERLKGMYEFFNEKLSFIFKEGFDLSIDNIRQITFTDDEKKTLDEVKAKINILTKDNSGATLKNLEYAHDKAKEIIVTFSDINEQTKENEFVCSSKSIESINKKIRLNDNINKTIEQSENLTDIIPLSWLKDSKWKDFVNKSIDFVKSLEPELQEKYSNDYCVYCDQKLVTEKSKKLVEAYKSLQEEHRLKLERLNYELLLLEQRFSKCISVVESIPQTMNLINSVKSELELINIKDSSAYLDNLDEVKKILHIIHFKIQNKESINLEENQIDCLIKFWEKYLMLSTMFKNKAQSLKKDLNDKQNQLEKYKRDSVELNNKALLCENKSKIIEYLEVKEAIKSIDEKLDELIQLKKTTSALESKFSNEEKMKSFNEHLEKEQKKLRFSPPARFNLKSTTNKGINKRAYSLGDNKISEIFSEGEKKLHALSDFLANGEIDNYKGVYIFDDPATSLDEERMDLIADRLHELVKEGNQVIVFTHNLVFLNLLVDIATERIHTVTNIDSQVIVEPNRFMDRPEELKNALKSIGKVIDRLSEKHKNGENVAEWEIRSMYSLMSGNLEEYVERVLLKNVISRYRSNIRMNSLEKLEDFDHDKLRQVATFYNKISRYVSRHSQPVSILQPNIKKLLEDFEDFKKCLDDIK